MDTTNKYNLGRLFILIFFFILAHLLILFIVFFLFIYFRNILNHSKILDISNDIIILLFWCGGLSRFFPRSLATPPRQLGSSLFIKISNFFFPIPLKQF